MSDPIDDIKVFFSTAKTLKAKGKDFLQLYKQITDYKKTNKQRSEKLNEPIIKFVQFSCELASNPEYSSIWQSLIDITSDIVNSYGSLHSGTDPHTFDVFFKPLLQEIDVEEHSDLYKFIERVLAKINLGFRIATSEYFRKLFLDAFASNVKRKLKESYDLFRIIHVHIPEIISPILTMHQAFLKNPNPDQREISIRFLVDVLIGIYTIKEELHRDVLDDFRKSFHEKDSESQRIVIENLSKYLLRKTYITNILIDDLKKCFDSHMISSQLLTVLVDQISLAIKECYHVAPNSLLDLLLTGCNHLIPSVAITCVDTIAYLYRLYYVKDPYPSPTRSRLDTVPRVVLHSAIKHPDLIVRIESQTRFFENIIFEHYRIDERTRQFFIFAQSDLDDEGVKNFGQLLHIQSELRSLLHKALVKCCTTSEKSLSRMSTSDHEEDITPDLEELDSENDDEHLTLNQILQKISELCFAPKEHGVKKLNKWIIKSEPKAREQLQSISSLTIDQSTLVDTTFSKTIIDMDDSTATINEALQLVEDRLASRVSIVFSHDFLQEFPSCAQAYFNEEAVLDEQTDDDDNNDDDDDDEDDSSSSSKSTENRSQNEQRQHRCIKQMGKLTKVLRPHLETSMDVEILEKCIEIIDETRPILSTFVFGILADFGALLGPGQIKTALIDRLIDVLVDAINKGDTTTMGKWAMRALVPIVGSNERQLENIITHDLFGKTKTSWWSTDGLASSHRWLLLSHIVKYAPSTRTMFNILQQIIRVILRHFPNTKNSNEPMKSFDEVTNDIQMRANQLKFLSRSANCIHVQRHGKSLIDDDDEDADDEDRIDTINLLIKFLLKLIKDVFIFPNNEIGRHYLQLQASIEVLRMLEIPEIFHSFAPTDYVELFTTATHQNAHVRHRFLQRILNKVAQWKLSVLFLGFTIAVPNDDEDLITGKSLKSVMERLYLLASKGSVETMQRLLPEKSISLMVYLHANNRSLIVEIDREVLDSITNSVKWSLRTMLQAREKTNKRFHGAIPKLLHSIKHSRSKADPLDDDLHHRIYLIVDIFQATFADLSPLEAYDFADTRNNLSGEPLLFTQPNFTNLNTKSYLPDFYKEKKVTKRSKKDETMLSDDDNNTDNESEMAITTTPPIIADDEDDDKDLKIKKKNLPNKKRQRSRAIEPPSSSSETIDDDEEEEEQIQQEEKENEKKSRKRKVSSSTR
ncbi:unnamed protein product [Rotaria sordida]|uniref:Uncharacterized protein n=1 Tax=Rotaria sordida TaxID=392033 RepID=A0A814DU24_9BILA|nr:unnamed protein product [Rotaria sordida]CAF3520687.1 unnamed protein product [Rotaria sordida]